MGAQRAGYGSVTQAGDGWAPLAEQRKPHAHFTGVQAENQSQYQKTWPFSTLLRGEMAPQPAPGSAGTASRAMTLRITLLSHCQFVNATNS